MPSDANKRGQLRGCQYQVRSGDGLIDCQSACPRQVPGPQSPGAGAVCAAGEAAHARGGEPRDGRPGAARLPAGVGALIILELQTKDRKDFTITEKSLILVEKAY